MRDAVVISAVLFLGFWALANPAVGVMLWTWLSLMNPHRYAWIASELPLALISVAVTLAGIVLSTDRKRLPVNAVTVTLGLFVAWFCVTHQYALYEKDAAELLVKNLKIQFMIFITLLVLHSKAHIHTFLWVIVGSLGILGAKGGLFTLATGGAYRVWGPPDSYIEGNNEFALALIMLIPLMHYLAHDTEKKWLRNGLWAMIGLCAISALGSHSRGALLAIAAMTFYLWLHAKNKLPFGIALFFMAAGMLAFMPSAWDERMSTIASYEKDASAMGRINAWWMAWNLATDRFFGGGFAIYEPAVFARYAPDPLDVHAAHSIYFQVLGEHGFIGLGLYLLVWLLTWRTANWIRRSIAEHPDMEWAGRLAAMCQVSLVGYAVGGAFLSLAYWDLPYDILVIMVLTQDWVRRELAQREAEAEATTALDPYPPPPAVSPPPPPWPARRPLLKD